MANKDQLIGVLGRLQLERDAYAHLRATDEPPYLYQPIDITGVEGTGIGTGPSVEELQGLGTAGGKLVVLDVRAPLGQLRAAARQLATANGRGKEPLLRLDAFDYENPNDDDALMRGETCLAQAQSLQLEGWALLALPPGISAERLYQSLAVLHHEDARNARARIEPGTLGRPEAARSGHHVIRTQHLTGLSTVMELTTITYAAWAKHRIVPLFDLLAWRRQQPMHDRDLAAWLWPDLYGPDALPIDGDFKRDIDAARKHLAQAIAVAGRLRTHVIERPLG